jgi:hypothetical protein
MSFGVAHIPKGLYTPNWAEHWITARDQQDQGGDDHKL